MDFGQFATALLLRGPRPQGERFRVSKEGWVPGHGDLVLEPLVHEIATRIFGVSQRDFAFNSDSFLSSEAAVAAGIVTYLSLVLGGRYLMKDRQPFSLKWLFFVHNLCLVVVSFVLLCLIAEVVLPMVYANGIFWSICDERAYGKHLEAWYYVNYLIKWWELIDTMFLVVKKKPLEFLHVYHHAATMLLTYVEMKGKTSVQWVPIALNLVVHVLMYTYYAFSSLGVRFWWKQHLTTLQISQFLLDLAAVYLSMWTHVAASRNWNVWHLGDCFGDENAGFFGLFILTSYLYLFVVLFVQTYVLKTRIRPSTQAAKKAAVNGHKSE